MEMKEYCLTHECDCGKELIHRVADMTEGPDIKIPVEFMCSQLDWNCESCGKTYGTGDIDIVEF